MFTIQPRTVSFGASEWENVRSITIDRTAAREVLDYTDAGPYPTLCDVPEQRIEITVVQVLESEHGIDAPRPSQSATLTFQTAADASDANRTTVQTTAVVTSVTHALAGDKAIRTIRLLAVASAGGSDPVSTFPS